jgi:cystathionine gamma-synthase
MTHFETLALQATKIHDLNAGAVVPPLYLSTTFERETDGTFAHGHIYSRASNPNRDQLEQVYATLENGAVGMAFASGQAATATVFQCLKPNDHVLLPDDSYHGTPALLQDILSVWGLTFSKVDMTDLEATAKAIQPNTRLIWIETPSNPLLKIVDIEAVCSLARANNAISVCDNTWATPVLIRPLDLGADVVMHSTTKYFGGHSDLLSGALIFKENDELTEKARKVQALCGAVPSPFDCWLLLRGIKTLALRVRQQSENALKLAQFLDSQTNIEKVWYPGLVTHQNYEIAQKQMSAFGGMLSVQIKGGMAEALAVAAKLKLFTRATSLGGVESLVEHRASVEGPNSTTPQNLLRVSVGLEHADDLILDFEQAISTQ